MVNRPIEKSPVMVQCIFSLLVSLFGTLVMRGTTGDISLIGLFLLMLIGPFSMLSYILLSIGPIGLVLGMIGGVALRVYSFIFWNRFVAYWSYSSRVILTVFCQSLLTLSAMWGIWWAINNLE